MGQILKEHIKLIAFLDSYLTLDTWDNPKAPDMKTYGMCTECLKHGQGM